MSNKRLLKVKVRDSENIIFEGEVDRISSFNEVGTFDVYPMHANFISILWKKLTFYQKNKIIKELQIEQAVMKVKQDKVKIFLGIEAVSLDNEVQTNENNPGKNVHNY